MSLVKPEEKREKKYRMNVEICGERGSRDNSKDSKSKNSRISRGRTEGGKDRGDNEGVLGPRRKSGRKKKGTSSAGKPRKRRRISLVGLGWGGRQR